MSEGQTTILVGRGVWLWCGVWLWSCPFCWFRRTWTTERGALTRVAQHLNDSHHRRMLAPAMVKE